MKRQRPTKTRQELLEIKREFLREKHQEAEAIFSKDKFSREDVDKLKYHYEVAAEYAEFFREFIRTDLESLKKELKKIMNDKVAVMDMSGIMKKVEQNVEKELAKLVPCKICKRIFPRIEMEFPKEFICSKYCK